MNRVVHIVDHLLYGGIENLVLNLISASSKRNENFVISLRGTAEEAYNRWHRIRELDSSQYVYLNKQEGFKPLLSYQILKILRKINPDVIHTHSSGPLFYVGLPAKILNIKNTSFSLLKR